MHDAIVRDGFPIWDGMERAVEVLVLIGAPLLDMTLLDECVVHLRDSKGGWVTIEPL